MKQSFGTDLLPVSARHLVAHKQPSPARTWW
jgi:hypothetical protein